MAIAKVIPEYPHDYLEETLSSLDLKTEVDKRDIARKKKWIG